MSSIISREELRALPFIQQPSYPDKTALDRTIDSLERLPPLVFAGECDDLRAKLADVAEGRAFLLQGGDCAETFEAVTADNIKQKLLVQLSMAVVMTYAARRFRWSRSAASQASTQSPARRTRRRAAT